MPTNGDLPRMQVHRLMVDGQHNMFAVTNENGETMEWDFPDDNRAAAMLQAICMQAQTALAQIAKRQFGFPGVSPFHLRPIVEDIEYKVHGDEVNVHVPVVDFFYPMSFRMPLDEFEGEALRMLDVVREARTKH